MTYVGTANCVTQKARVCCNCCAHIELQGCGEGSERVGEGGVEGMASVVVPPALVSVRGAEIGLETGGNEEQ